jgi:hypothetical protein
MSACSPPARRCSSPTTPRLIAINGLAGLALAPYAALATLPVTCWVIGGAIATMPASFHMKRVGRQRGLDRGSYGGIAGALICAAAIWMQSFWLLCFGTLVWGAYNAFGQYYRFAAADVATPDFRATAISLVLAGGLVGGILGPSTSRFTIDLVEPQFMGAYLVAHRLRARHHRPAALRAHPARRAAERSAAGRPLARDRARSRSSSWRCWRGGRLRGHEFAHDLDADRDAGLRPSLRRRRLRDLVARGGDVRAVVRHRLASSQRFGVLPVMWSGVRSTSAAIGVALSGIAVATSGGRWCCSAWAGTSSTSAAPRCSPRPTVPKNAPRRRARTTRRSSS